MVADLDTPSEAYMSGSMSGISAAGMMVALRDLLEIFRSMESHLRCDGRDGGGQLDSTIRARLETRGRRIDVGTRVRYECDTALGHTGGRDVKWAAAGG